MEKLSSKTVAEAICQKILNYAVREGNAYDSIDELRLQEDSFWINDIHLTTSELAKVKGALGSKRGSQGPSGHGSQDPPPSDNR